MRFFILLGISALIWSPLAGGESADDNNGASWEREEWDLPVELDPKITIGKIYDFLLDEKYTPTGDNPVLKQEYRYFYYGAITPEQRSAARGHYYIVNFANKGDAADLTVRMDFRQLLSRDTVNTLEVSFPNFKGRSKQQFVIAGDMYKAYGDVNSWRISVVRNGKIVAQKKSYVW